MNKIVWAKNTKTGNVGFGAKEITLRDGTKVVQVNVVLGGKIAFWKNYEIMED